MNKKVTSNKTKHIETELHKTFKLRTCLLGTVKLTQNVDPYKYGYSGYGVIFHAHSVLLSDVERGKNVNEMITVLLCMLVIKKKISQFLVKVQQMDQMK